MKGYIDNYNFAELEVQRYWQPPSTWSADKKKTEVHNRIFSGDWLGARKVDGALYVFIKDEDGNITLRGRAKSVNGTYIDKWNHVPHLHKWGEDLPYGCCFLGEIYWPGHEGSNNTTSIMNCLTPKAIQRQEKDENKLHYYIFDVLAFANFSWMKADAWDRFNFLKNISDGWSTQSKPYIEFAQYVTGERLWNTLQDLLSEGYEGMVIAHRKAKYEPGKRPSKTTLKIKKELKETIDCFFTGRAAAPTKEYTGKEIENWPYWVDTYTDERIPVGEHYREVYFDNKTWTAVTKPYYNHWAGSLEIGVYDGDKVVGIGYLSGLAEEIKQNYKLYKGKVIEVGAMQLTDDLRLRHGKMIGWRPDKTAKECTIDQLKA